jgi:hypothetical protein
MPDLCTMRPLLILLLVLPVQLIAQEELLKEVRKAVAVIFDDEEASRRMSSRFADADVSTSPVLMGYKGAVIMAQGKHSANPLTKLRTFNEGRALLDTAIVREPKSVELRFLRLSIQVNVPRILGYSSQVAEDRAFIDRNLGSVHSDDFRQRVTNFIAKAEEQGKL